VAESSDLIIQIGEWVLTQACQEFATLTRQVEGGEHLGLSINLSPRQFSDPLLADTVRKALTNAGLIATRLTLEITESTIMEDVARTAHVLAQLRSFGARVSIDDFGTGYSSLSLLSEILVDELKIDRVFVTDVATRPEPARLIRAILLLASDFGLHTVGEGLEELDQLQLLEELGCQSGQGYFFARPMPAGQLLELLQRDLNSSDSKQSRQRTLA
jgi:EAL domain-containing protein (putative c-di-GMP-specific phosphodiesterase class I)